ncbi:unnamed protein product [Rotaria socialis]
MLSPAQQTISSSCPTPTGATGTGHRRAALLFKHSYSTGSATTSSVGSLKTPKTGSVLSEYRVFDEHDYEMTRQTMRDLIEEIQIEKPFISFNDMFLDQDDIVGCLLRIFNEYAENINGTKQIKRERMSELLENSKIFNDKYTLSMYIDDWNNFRKQMIKKKIYERKTKTLDFCGFVQMIDIIKNHLNTNKDEILKKIIGSQIYNDIIKLKEIRHKIQYGLLPSMNILVNQSSEIQPKINERHLIRKKKKKKKKTKSVSSTAKKIKAKVKSKNKKINSLTRSTKKRDKSSRNRKNPGIDKKKSMQQRVQTSPQAEQSRVSIKVSSKEVPKLKTVSMLEPWIVRDDLDNDLKTKLFELFKLSSEQFEHGLIRQNVFIQWLRASHVIPDTYSTNIIEGVLSDVLARNINVGTYQLNVETFEWNGFMDCIQALANEIHLSSNEFVKKMLIADEFSLQRWRVETERIPLEAGTGKQTSRPWDSKKVDMYFSSPKSKTIFSFNESTTKKKQVLATVNIMRDVIEESRKLHLTDDERKRLRSLYKEFAAFAYRRQSAHLEARLTNSVLSSWMRECRIFDDKYTINELDKDFISILGDFTLNGVYPQGTRDIDFDGFLILIQTIAAHKHIRADDLVQMIFAGPRSPLQKASEFNEHMDRTKIQTSQIK